ncbi:unnamed protein product [Phytomonas sp. EM1]|nr:unnamed protein product [Phytomonas sp. EM1]|eukprot:CCW64566.1 unnamed protein product [Phytomonas sp. isolate EM1]
MSDWDPPVAPMKDHVVLFGRVDGEDRGDNAIDPPIRRQDPYFWLRDDARTDPDVLAHLRREKAHFEARTRDTEELARAIYEEHLSHIKETDRSAHYLDGGFLYYTREEAGQAYKIHCRVPQGAEVGGPAEEVLLDINALAKGKAFCHVANVSPAPPTHELIAYTVDWSGNEVYMITFLPNARGVTEEITGTDGDVVWAADASSFFYTTKDEALRSDKIWRHIIGEPQEKDVCVYSEKNPLFSVFINKCTAGHTCILGSNSPETSEVYLLDLRKGNTHNALELVRAREKGVLYDVDLHDPETLVIQTNEGGAFNNKIILATRREPADWRTVLIPHSEECYYCELSVYRKFLLVSGRTKGLTAIWVLFATRKEGSAEGWVFLPGTELRMERFSEEAVATVDVVYSQMKLYDTDTYRMTYSSLSTPRKWMDVNPFTGEQSVVKAQEVGGGFNSEDYIVQRRFATAPDREKIPISLVYHKDLDLSRPQPCMLYGYGSYGLCIEPEFSIRYLPYVERGMIYAIAHIRGGSELGRRWYEIGAKYLTKRNTFSDFIAAAEELIEGKLTTPSQLSCEGRSAGGLLIGAVINMRPDLFQVALAGVPFVDVMTTMCDPSIPLTIGEWEQWGNPNEYRYFDYMLSYSPIDNVRAQRYPNLLVQAGLHDPRVAYWEPAKWVAKLRAHQTNDAEILLNMDLESGHFSATDRYKYWRESASQQAFVCKHLKTIARLFRK